MSFTTQELDSLNMDEDIRTDIMFSTTNVDGIRYWNWNIENLFELQVEGGGLLENYDLVRIIELEETKDVDEFESLLTSRGYIRDLYSLCLPFSVWYQMYQKSVELELAKPLNEVLEEVPQDYKVVVQGMMDAYL